MMQVYQENGLAIDLASARVCQDIVLMAIANGPLIKNAAHNSNDDRPEEVNRIIENYLQSIDY